jgi:hypothetical protein
LTGRYDAGATDMDEGTLYGVKAIAHRGLFTRSASRIFPASYLDAGSRGPNSLLDVEIGREGAPHNEVFDILINA